MPVPRRPYYRDRTTPKNDGADYLRQMPSMSWLKNARCAWENRPKVFLGKETADLTEEQHLRMIDRSFQSEKATGWTSESETIGMKKAISECLRCPVQRECLDYATQPQFAMNPTGREPVSDKKVENNPALSFGVYGGTTPWERLSIMRENGLFPSLDRDARFRILQRMVEAKIEGLIPQSVRLDFLRQRMRELAEDDTSWDPAIAAMTEAEVAS